MAFLLKNKTLSFYYFTLSCFLFYCSKSSFLFNLDYEFFFVLNGFLSFHIILLHAFKSKNLGVKHSIISFLITVTFCLTINIFKQSICSISDSLYWFILQGLGGLLVSTALFSLSFNLFNHSFLKRALFHIAFIVLLSLPTLYDILFGPQLSFLHPIFGYFHGPIYDAYIPKPHSFLWFRVWTSLLAIPTLYFFSKKRTPLFTRSFKISLHVFLALLLIIPMSLRYSFTWAFSYSDIKKTLDQHIGYGPIQLYYSNKTYNKKEAQVLLKSLHFEYMFLADQLQFNPSELDTVNVYIYPDQYSKKMLTGTGLTLIGNALQKSIHALPINPKSSIFRHELAHIILRPYGFYGLSISPALLEGLATSLEYERHGLSVHEWAKAIAQRPNPPKLEELFSPTGFWSKNSYISYLYTGSFMRWLLSHFPKEKVLASYALGNFTKHLGQELNALEQQWLQFIKNTELSKVAKEKAELYLKQKPITQQKCPHQVACIKKLVDSCNDLSCKISLQQDLIEQGRYSNTNAQLKLATYYLENNAIDSSQSLIKKLQYEKLNPAQVNYLDLLEIDSFILKSDVSAAWSALKDGIDHFYNSIDINFNDLNAYMFKTHLEFRLDNLSNINALKQWLEMFYQRLPLKELNWSELKVPSLFKFILLLERKDFSMFSDELIDLKYSEIFNKLPPIQQSILLKSYLNIYEHFHRWDKAAQVYSKLLEQQNLTEGERFYYKHQLKRIKSLQP